MKNKEQVRMDSETQIPYKRSNTFLTRHCCLLSFLLLLSLLFSSSVLFILLILKPKKPTFHLRSIHLDPIKLDATSGKGIFLEALTASLLFNAQNCNMFGIRYSPSSFGMTYGGNPIGVIKMPGFYQPPNGANVTVMVHVLTERVDISRLLDGPKSFGGACVESRIIGFVRARIQIINFSFPVMKISLDCRISLDFKAEAFRKALVIMKAHKVLVLSKFPHLNQKCSVAL